MPTQAELEAAASRAQARVIETAGVLDALRPEAAPALLAKDGELAGVRAAWEAAKDMHDRACAEYARAVQALFDGMEPP